MKTYGQVLRQLKKHIKNKEWVPILTGKETLNELIAILEDVENNIELRKRNKKIYYDINNDD